MRRAGDANSRKRVGDQKKGGRSEGRPTLEPGRQPRVRRGESACKFVRTCRKSAGKERETRRVAGAWPPANGGGGGIGGGGWREGEEGWHRSCPQIRANLPQIRSKPAKDQKGGPSLGGGVEEPANGGGGGGGGRVGGGRAANLAQIRANLPQIRGNQRDQKWRGGGV